MGREIEVPREKVVADKEYFMKVTMGNLMDAVKYMPEELWAMDENEIRLLLKPNKVDWSLRGAFWAEIDRMYLEGRTHAIQSNIFKGVCNETTWQKKIKNKYFAAFIFCPTRHYEAEIESLLARGVDRYWEIVDMDINVISRDGVRSPTNIDPRKAKIVLDAMREITDRAKGLALQRIETTGKLTVESQGPLTMERIDEKIKLLEGQLDEGVIEGEIQPEED